MALNFEESLISTRDKRRRKAHAHAHAWTRDTRGSLKIWLALLRRVSAASRVCLRICPLFSLSPRLLAVKSDAFDGNQRGVVFLMLQVALTK